MAVELEDVARTEQRYDHGTAILRTRLFDDRRPGHRNHRLRAALLAARSGLPPGAAGAPHPPVAGQPRVRVIGAPARRLGRDRAAASRAAATTCASSGPTFTLRLNTNAPITYLMDGTCSRSTRPMSFFLGPDETLTGGIEDTAREFEEQTALLLAPLDAPPRAAAGVAGGGDPRRHHAQAVPVRGDRRDRRRHDHQHSRGARQRAQLGLPLLLAARRVLRGARAQQPVRSRHDGGLPALARQRGAQRADGGHVQPLYGIGLERSSPERIVPQAARLSRHGAGARRQPGARALPARRVRQHRPRRGAGLPRPPAVPPRRREPTSRALETHGRAGLARCTTSPTPACGSCARAPACTPRRR